MFVNRSTPLLVILALVVSLGSAAVGVVLGRRHRPVDTVVEQASVTPASLLGLTGLLLAFALSLGVGRNEGRRTAVLAETNAIERSWHWAQLLAEPERSSSLSLLGQYLDTRIHLTPEQSESAHGLQGRLWAIGGTAMASHPGDSRSQEYVNALNDVFAAETTRRAAMVDTMPASVTLSQFAVAAVALAVFGYHLGLLGRGIGAALAALTLAMMLFVTIDLDRPNHGFIRVSEASLTRLRAMVEAGPTFGP